MNNEELKRWEAEYEKRLEELNKIKKTSKEKLIQHDENMENKIVLTDIETNSAICHDLRENYLFKLSKKRSGHPYVGIGRMVVFLEFRDKKEIRTTGILLGYIADGNLYTSDEELNGKKFMMIYSLVHVLDSEDEKVINSLKKVHYGAVSIVTNETRFQKALNKLKIKIKDGHLSGKIWGFVDLKKSLVDTVTKNYKIEKGISKILGETYYIVVTHVNEETGKEYNIKYCLYDIEFVLPTLKGYSLPKDKTIRKNSIVRLKKPNEKYSEQKLMVINVTPNKSSGKLQRSSNNRKLDVIQCLTPDNKLLRFKAKDLKFIQNAESKTEFVPSNGIF